MPHTNLRRRIASAAVLSSVALCFSAQAATAQTLDGEHFEPANHIEAIGVQGTCNASGPSTFGYSSFGQATGPVNDTYETYGEFTLASPTGPVTAISGNFTIHGNEAWITGTQTLAESVVAWCTPGEQEDLQVEAKTNYSVLNPFTEQGPATLKIGATTGWATQYSADFGVQETPPPPPSGLPTSKEQCLNGGWKTFEVFKNQGECIAYVSHLGKKA